MWTTTHVWLFLILTTGMHLNNKLLWKRSFKSYESQKGIHYKLDYRVSSSYKVTIELGKVPNLINKIVHMMSTGIYKTSRQLHGHIKILYFLLCVIMNTYLFCNHTQNNTQKTLIKISLTSKSIIIFRKSLWYYVPLKEPLWYLYILNSHDILNIVVQNGSSTK